MPRDRGPGAYRERYLSLPLSRRDRRSQARKSGGAVPARVSNVLFAGAGSRAATIPAGRRRAWMSLVEHMQDVPVLILPCVEGRPEGRTPERLSGLYGNILPAAWSLMLALRARGVGAAWTTIALTYEKEVATLLGLPDTLTAAAVLAVAYFKGEDFKPANVSRRANGRTGTRGELDDKDDHLPALALRAQRADGHAALPPRRDPGAGRQPARAPPDEAVRQLSMGVSVSRH